MGKKLKKYRFTWFVILALFFCHAEYGLAQAVKGHVANAVKEAQAVGVPTTTLNQLLAVGYENQLEPAALVGFIQILIDARRDGIPLEPFSNKVEEGLAKHVPHSTIQQVLIRKLEDYRFTHSLIANTLKKRGKSLTIEPRLSSSHLRESFLRDFEGRFARALRGCPYIVSSACPGNGCRSGSFSRTESV